MRNKLGWAKSDFMKNYWSIYWFIFLNKFHLCMYNSEYMRDDESRQLNETNWRKTLQHKYFNLVSQTSWWEIIFKKSVAICEYF